MMNRIIDYIVALGDLFMPRSCLACGCRLGMRERHLCLSCAADVPYTRFWLAPHNPLADRFNAVLERHRGTGPMDYAYAAALIYYKGAYRAIPRALKYQGDLAAGRHYGAFLGRRLAAAPHFADIDLILPVPLHWTRRWTRGYNQAEILARALSDAFRVSSAQSDAFRVAPSPPEVRTDLLVRVRRTRTQTRLSVEEKAHNVMSAFQVPDRFPLWPRVAFRLARVLSSRSARGPFGSGLGSNDLRETPAGILASARHILLVDDTFTTGATLYACYAALRPFTNARISIATLAAVEGTPSGTGGVPPAPVPVSASTPDAPSVSAAPPSAPGVGPVSVSFGGP